MAVILAGGEGERLSILSSVRAKPAVPFGGKYRIIDFTLSNCVNSEIDNVVVLTQYNPRSLNDHIGLGRPWDLDRNTGGVKMLQPYIARGRVAEWYRGTADAVLQNINVLERDSSDSILVLAGDHIYKMDYQPFVAAHRAKRADRVAHHRNKTRPEFRPDLHSANPMHNGSCQHWLESSSEFAHGLATPAVVRGPFFPCSKDGEPACLARREYRA